MEVRIIWFHCLWYAIVWQHRHIGVMLVIAMWIVCFHFSYTAASVIDTASKYKLLWKMPLEDVDVVKGLLLACIAPCLQSGAKWLQH